MVDRSTHQPTIENPSARARYRYSSTICLLVTRPPQQGMLPTQGFTPTSSGSCLQSAGRTPAALHPRRSRHSQSTCESATCFLRHPWQSVHAPILQTRHILARIVGNCRCWLKVTPGVATILLAGLTDGQPCYHPNLNISHCIYLSDRGIIVLDCLHPRYRCTVDASKAYFWVAWDR